MRFACAERVDAHGAEVEAIVAVDGEGLLGDGLVGDGEEDRLSVMGDVVECGARQE